MPKKNAKIANTIKPVNKPIAVKAPFSKSQLISTIVERTGQTKKQVIAMMDTLMKILEAHLSKKGPGAFVLPGYAKFRTIKKPATKARKGTNPFTGEPMTFAAKPARTVVKIKALKKLKDLIK